MIMNPLLDATGNSVADADRGLSAFRDATRGLLDLDPHTYAISLNKADRVNEAYKRVGRGESRQKRNLPWQPLSAPAWQDVFGRDDEDGRVRSCGRPVVAVYMTAGPDEVRGLAPIQVIAFKYAEPQ